MKTSIAKLKEETKKQKRLKRKKKGKK